MGFLNPNNNNYHNLHNKTLNQNHNNLYSNSLMNHNNHHYNNIPK